MAKKAAPKAKLTPFKQLHKDGTLWAKGQKRGESFEGYWEWFRKDGTILRSGSFTNNVQTGTWTTYDQKGKVYKVTEMKSKAAKKK